MMLEASGLIVLAVRNEFAPIHFSSAKPRIIRASSWPLPHSAVSSCIPKPRSRTGSPLSSNRAPSTRTALIPTGSEYSSHRA
jgi:hypothetical protein